MAEHQFRARRRVEFSDTDMAGIMHFSNFFRFMETVEHGFYRSMGFSVHPDGALEEHVGWPRVHSSCDYKLPLLCEEIIEMELLVEEIRSRSIRYKIRFWKDPDGSPQLAAVGKLAIVCVKKNKETRKMEAVHIPEQIRRKMEAAPAELLEDPS